MPRQRTCPSPIGSSTLHWPCSPFITGLTGLGLRGIASRGLARRGAHPGSRRRPVVQSFWLVAEYLPSLLDTDRQRFPATLADQAEALGVDRVDRAETAAIPHDCTDGFLGPHWQRPECYVEPAGGTTWPPSATEGSSKGVSRPRHLSYGGSLPAEDGVTRPKRTPSGLVSLASAYQERAAPGWGPGRRRARRRGGRRPRRAVRR